MLCHLFFVLITENHLDFDTMSFTVVKDISNFLCKLRIKSCECLSSSVEILNIAVLSCEIHNLLSEKI